MTGDNPQYHNYNIGKVGSYEFNNCSATNHPDEAVSLELLMNETEEATEEQEIENPSEAWLMSGINKRRIKSK